MKNDPLNLILYNSCSFFYPIMKGVSAKIVFIPLENKLLNKWSLNDC